MRKILTGKLTPNNPAVAKGLLSLLIVATVSIQAYTAVLRVVCSKGSIPLFCDLPAEPGLYPFLDYPMYDGIEQEGASVPNYRLIAIFADGTERQLIPEDFGLSSYWFNTRLLPAFEDQQAEQIESYVAAYKAAGSQPFDALRFEDNSLTITREGIVEEVAPEAFTLSTPTATKE